MIPPLRPLWVVPAIMLVTLAPPTSPPATAPATTSAKPRPFFVGERIPAFRHGTTLDWAVIRKVGRYHLYVEWEGWEGFTGDWLPPEKLKRENPLFGKIAPLRTSKRKPAVIPPEPPVPDDLANGGTEQPPNVSKPLGVSAESVAADAPVLSMPDAVSRPLDVVTGRYEADDHGAVMVASRGADARYSTDGTGSSPVKDGSLLTFGPTFPAVVILREAPRDKLQAMVRVDLNGGETSKPCWFPHERKVVGVSRTGRRAVSAGGFFGNEVEIWDTTTTKATRLCRFATAAGVHAHVPRWAEFFSDERVLVTFEGDFSLLLSIPAGPGTTRITPVQTQVTPPDVIARIDGIRTEARGGFSPTGKYLAVITSRGQLALLREEGSIALLGTSSDWHDDPVFFADGRGIFERHGRQRADVSRQPHESRIDGPKAAAIVNADFYLSAEGDLVRWKGKSALWHYRVGTPRENTPLDPVQVAGGLWRYDAAHGELAALDLPLAPALEGEKHPLPDVPLPVRGNAVRLKINLDPADDAVAVRACAEKLVAEAGGRVAAPTDNATVMLSIASRRGSEKRSYTSMYDPDKPFDHTPVLVDCPFCSVQIRLTFAGQTYWSHTAFGGATGFVQLPKGMGLQEYASSLFAPADKLFAKVEFPETVPPPDARERTTTYLPG